MQGISAKLPLSISEIDAAYTLTKTLKENTKQNFKMLLLTIPGERMMDPDFGVGLERFLFEMNDELTYSKISARLHEQIEKYMPFIAITDFYVGPGDDSRMAGNQLNVSISYEIIPTSEEDVLSLPLAEKQIEF